MSNYSYRLYSKREQTAAKHAQEYTRLELERMTTYQLRDICLRERLVASMLGNLARHEIIELILRYRGAEENRLIGPLAAGGEQRLADLLKRLLLCRDDEAPGQNPTRIVAYEGLDTDRYDRYMVTPPGPVGESNVLLVSGDNELCAVFNLRADKSQNGRFYLTRRGVLPASESSRKNYSLLYFAKAESELLHKVYYDEAETIPPVVKAYRLPLLNFEIRQPVVTAQTLAIDFGTANTTAGLYLDRELYGDIDKGGAAENLLRPEAINMVEVFQQLDGEEQLTPLIPSVVGVWNIREDATEQIEYVFGHEAVRLARTNYIHEGFCVFFDIKRWIRDPERLEEITDRKGKRIFRPRKEIIQAFLKHVISLAEQRFKCRFQTLHLSAPVKEKRRFQKLFQEILGEWQLETQNMLDEGAAVLFNTISRFIEKNPNRYIDKEEHQALIIDCGGGTTDLSSCRFSIESRRVSYRIDIETTYENGDTDFGGNNLTFRIMQLLKIALAEQLSGRGYAKIRRLLSAFDGDLCRRVDEIGIAAIYAELEQEYDAAERLLPTRFREYESGSLSDYYKIKSNFYYLFQLAEQIKTELYAGARFQRISLDCSLEPSHAVADAGDRLLDAGRWRLARRDGDVLKMLEELPPLCMTNYDIGLLLEADIYEMIRKFVEGPYEQGNLLDFDIIKLTGQSCKIGLFQEALKEFIPGRVIEFGGRDENNGLDLKLACLRGAIEFLKAKKGGYAEVTMRHRPAVLPYVITAETHNGDEITLISRVHEQNTGGFISRFVEGVLLKLQLKDQSGQTRYTFIYDNRREDFAPVTYEQIYERYGERIIQDETDNIIENEVKFFVWPQERDWGFVVVPVLRQDSNLLLGREELFYFENDLWETNFFDGTK